MKRWIFRWLAAASLVIVYSMPAFAAKLLVPVGEVVGLALSEGTVTVAAFHESYGGAARDAGVQIGDEILSVDGRAVDSAQDLYDALKRSGGTVTVCLRREGREQEVRLSPTATASAEKGAIFAANLSEPLGFRCVPNATESRHDIIQAVELRSEEGMIAFCKGIQAAAPVDSFATPIPGDMPGYDSQVIMAAGAFIQGSTMELSADGPIRPPYAVYFQGGLTWYHAKLGILMSLQKMVDAGLVNI